MSCMKKKTFSRKEPDISNFSENNLTPEKIRIL